MTAAADIPARNEDRELRALELVRRGDPAAAEPEFEEEVEPCAQAGDARLVGSLVWTLDAGEQWLLGPECAFLFRDCWRRAVAREPEMLARACDLRQRLRDTLWTLWRRFITGEPLLLDLYVAERDGAELGISSDEIGGNLYALRLGSEPLICRKGVYFGSQPDVRLRAETPLASLRRARGWRARLAAARRCAFGPGWIFQRFESLVGDARQLILQIDGDVYYRELEEGEVLRSDPRHSYAWDESVTWEIVEFGSVVDRLLRGGIPYQVEFRGPGRVWLSNMSFADAYVGHLFTPSHWLYRVREAVGNLFGYLNPGSWL